jgi:hypothetical protein
LDMDSIRSVDPDSEEILCFLILDALL